MRISSTILAAVGFVVCTVLVPVSAEACGLKGISMESTVSYSGQHITSNIGELAIYGKTRINRRLALALQASGHRIFRTRRVVRAASADIVLTSAALASRVESSLRGSNTIMVVVLAPGESAPKAAAYVVRQRDRVYVQLAMLEKALRDRRGV